MLQGGQNIGNLPMAQPQPPDLPLQQTGIHPKQPGNPEPSTYAPRFLKY